MAHQIIWSLQARDDLREIVLHPYRIIYRVIPAQQVVAIARIWRGARGEQGVPDRLEF